MQIDQNNRIVGLGYVQGTHDAILPLSCDPDNEDRLLIEIVPVGSLSMFVPNHMATDGNTRNTAGAVSDDANETIIPLTVELLGGGNSPHPCLRTEVTII